MKKAVITIFRLRKYAEPFIWTIALICLFLMQPSANANTFCIFKMFGFNSCIGCGIGHAIHYALLLNFKTAFEHHILGIPAAIILIFNTLSSYYIIFVKPKYHAIPTHAHDASRPSPR